MPPKTTAVDPIRTALIHRRVQLQIKIYLAGGHPALERELDTVERTLSEHDANPRITDTRR